MTEVHTCILWRFFLSLAKEPIKSSKQVISVASSCASVKTESLLLLPRDVGSFRWFRRWSLAGFLPSHHPTPPWVSWFRGLFSVTGPVSRNRPLKWQCDLEHSTIHSALCSSPWIQFNISKYSHFCCRNGAREVMRLSNDAMFANLLRVKVSTHDLNPQTCHAIHSPFLRKHIYIQSDLGSIRQR